MSKQENSLLSSANLAWTQPVGVAIVAPAAAPVPIVSEVTATEIDSNFQTPDGQVLSNVATTTLSTHETRNVANTIEEQFDQLNISQPPQPQQSVDASASAASSSLSSPSTIPTFNEVDVHWFYQKNPEQPDVWTPFSHYDSTNLENGLAHGWHQTNATIPVNGTRYDVSLRDRTRTPVYWNGATSKVQRCTWFYKQDSDYRFVPYPEEVASILEYNYRDCHLTNSWYRRVEVSNSEFVVFYAADSVYHYISDGTTQQESWGSMVNDTHMTPRYAYRGLGAIGASFPREESQPVDHVMFMVHGIGDFCDISFRKLVEVVDDFREVSQELLQSHYNYQQQNQIVASSAPTSPTGEGGPSVLNSTESSAQNSESSVGRMEVLPISWHSVLHTQQMDTHLKKITLPSIPRMRSFTNDTILDALFYTSTAHAQNILVAVATELNRIYSLFISRNPNFRGSVALGGHSLGSLILFDLLNHQATVQGDYNSQNFMTEQLYFHPACFFAFGSPIPVFLTVRGVYSLGVDYRLPTCRAFFNIFHPYDPIAYRVEPLINPELDVIKPVLVPHHKGRKRFHLELRESIARMGTDIKQKVLTSIKGTIDSIYGFVKLHQNPEIEEDTQNGTGDQVEQPVESEVVQQQQQQLQQDQHDVDEEAAVMKKYSFGQLNGGRRIDHVLQERPIEIVNEYLFAIASHGCYWLSEDTALLVLRELYGAEKNL